MHFDVWYNGDVCGIINTYNDGLYTVFNVSTDIVSYDILRVYLLKGDVKILLGVLMPKKNKLSLTKKLLISHLKKFEFDENFKAIIDGNNFEISDENLKRSMCNEIIVNENIYRFKYSDKEKFLFDFCISLCKITKIFDEIFIEIKLNSNGQIEHNIKD